MQYSFCRFLTCALILIVSLYSPAFADTYSDTDVAECKKVVTSYCNLWKQAKYEEMYSTYSEKAQRQLNKKRFITKLTSSKAQGGKLSRYEKIEQKKLAESLVMQVTLTFSKRNESEYKNGIYRFHMVNVDGKWKIKSVVPPLDIPKLNPNSTGHPGL